MRKALATAAALALASPALAQDSVTVTAEDGLHFIRCIDMLGTASCEFIAANTDGFLTCIALDADGKPLASTLALAQTGNASFPDLDHRRVARLICRR